MQIVEFRTERSGHISIRGELSSNGRKGFIQKLTLKTVSIKHIYLNLLMVLHYVAPNIDNITFGRFYPRLYIVTLLFRNKNFHEVLK